MANPYKNTKTSPLNQTKWDLQSSDPNLRNISRSDKNAYNQGQTEALGFAATFLPIGGLVGGAVRHGGKALNFFKKAWNYGKKGGFGYQKAVATGKPLTQNAIVSYKNWGGKSHKFENLQDLRITKADIANANKANKLTKITGSLGRGTVIGGAVVATGNQLDKSTNELREQVIDNTRVTRPQNIKTINETFTIKDLK